MNSSASTSTSKWRTQSQKLLKSFFKVDNDVSMASLNPVNAIYYPNWQVYHQPPSALSLDNVSHVFYAFAWVKPDGNIYPSDEHADTQTGVDGVHGCLNAFQRLKQQRPQLKTILSVGGGGNGSAPFAGVARSPEARKTFAASAKRLVDAYHFDGIDIDWEHPENPSQGADYVSLLKALRESLTAPKYLVTTALPAGEWALRNIDLKKAQSSLDYINLMAYDFSGPWTSTSGHQSQLYAPPQAPPESQSSGGSAVAYMKSKGVPSNKILLGIPVYGRSFLGASQINQKFTGSGGHEGTFEYRELPRPGAQEQFDQHAVAAFCVGGDGGFVSYDNPRTVELKAQFAKREKLAGLFYWTGTGDKNGSESLVAAGHRVLCS